MSFSVKKNTIVLTRGDTFKGRITINNLDGSEYEPQTGAYIKLTLLY